MDIETKEILEKQTELIEENNVMLRKIRRVQVVSTVTWALKWVIILGSGFGFYYYFQPAILQLFGVYDSMLQNMGEISEMFKNFQAPN